MRGLPLLLGTWILLGALLFLAHDRDRELDYRLGLQRARAAVRLQTSLLSAELNTIMATADFLAADPTLAAFLSHTGTREGLEHRFASFCTSLGRFDQVRLLDLEGQELVRVERDGHAVPVPELQSKRDRYYFRRAVGLSAGEFYVSRFDLNMEQGVLEEPWKPVVRLATPVEDDSGTTRGVLVLNFLGEELLDRLQSASVKALTPTFWIDGQGHFLEGPAPDLSWTFMFDRQPGFALHHPDAWEALGNGGNSNYQGANGLYVQRPVTSLLSARAVTHDMRLRAVTHLPRELLYATSRRSLKRLTVLATGIGLVLSLVILRLSAAAALRRRHERLLVRSRRDLQRLSAQVLDVQEEERRRLSRDLHDELGQLATVVNIQLKRARRSVESEEKDALIDLSLEGANALLEGTHKLSTSLRSRVLNDLGLDTALRATLAPLEKAESIHLALDLRAGDEGLDPHHSTHAFRIAQEAVTNAIRHAQAASVAVRTWTSNGSLHLLVQDDGCGFDPEACPPGRLGLAGMRERAALCGGILEVTSRAGAGTTVEATFPFTSSEEAAA